MGRPHVESTLALVLPTLHEQGCQNEGVVKPLV